MRVLVQLIHDDDRTDAGLYLPAGAKEAQDDALYGKVIEVARDRPTTDDVAENVSDVPHGAFVLFRKEADVRVPWDERLRLIDGKDVLATVEEGHADEAHGVLRRDVLRALALAAGAAACGKSRHESPAPALALAPVPDPFAPFTELLTSFIADHHIPGASLTVSRAGRIVYARGFG